jgi:hypothetical protein
MTNETASQIIDMLKSQANDILGSAVGSVPLRAFATGANGGLPYNWQDSLNVTLFNKKTYDWIGSGLKAGGGPVGQDGVFTNLYIRALSSVSWSLSEADQATLNRDQERATQQAMALQNAWIAAFGGLPAGDNPINAIATEIATKWANPPATLTAIKNSINLDQLLNTTPAAGEPVRPVFVNWLNALGASVSLQNNVTMNNAYAARALAAVQSPSENNGALKLNDQSLVPAYQVSTPVNVIQNAMNAGTPKIVLDMTVQRSSESEFTVKASGGTSFAVPVLEFLSVGVSAHANYFASDIATASNTTTVHMEFPGVNLVNFGPVNFQETGASKYWFWMDPIREAIRNRGRETVVSGFKFAPDPGIDFSAAGPFGYLQGVAISSYPTIVVTVKSADYRRIQQTFEQSVSSRVSFLGITLASATESTCSNKVSVDAASSTVTITISPPPTLVAGTSNDQRGWVLGAQPVYPAA